MVAALVLDFGLTRSQLKHRVFRRAMFSKKRADFFAFAAKGKTFFTLCPARLAYLLDM
ncbi:hypothetical protein ACVIIV_000493 [Bradyrhizobium sp. USDA 4354]